jgi:hypothetical protein
VKCEKIQLKLSAYIDGEDDATTHLEIDDHLKRCPECREELEALSGVDILLRDQPQLSLPADFAKVVVSRAQDMASVEPRRVVLRWTWKTVLRFCEKFFELLEPQALIGTRSLDEFNDVPTSFMGYAYFKMLGSQR